MAHSASPGGGAEPILIAESVAGGPLAGVDLRVEAGERVAVIGESGCGKTTLLRYVLGLARPGTGAIRLLGNAPRRAASVQGLGVAFQQPGLVDAWTVYRNLAVAARGISKEEVRELLNAVGLDEVALDAPAGRLSGGQQKRVSLLRAWLRARDLLILDEPTSGMDVESTVLVADFLVERTSADTAILMITHDLHFAARVCGRALVLGGGACAAELRAKEGEEGLSAEVLSRALSSTPGAPTPVRRLEGKSSRGTFSLWLDLILFGLLLAIPALFALGMLVVGQMTASTYFDVSRYVPRALVEGAFRELAPLVAGLLLGARAGARVASHVAAMRYTAQLESLRFLGVSVVRLVLLPYLVAGLLAFPLVLVGAAASAVIGGALTGPLGVAHLSIGVRRFALLAREGLRPVLVVSCITKGAIMGVVVAAGGFWAGSRPLTSAEELGRRVTAGTVLASVLVVLADMLVSATLLR